MNNYICQQLFTLSLLTALVEPHSTERIAPYSYRGALSKIALFTNKSFRETYLEKAQMALAALKYSSLAVEAPSETSNCTSTIISILFNALHLKLGGLEMLDAFGRPEPGFTGGAINWPGSFDLCLDETYWERVQTKTKYCNLLIAFKWSNNTVINVHVGINIGVCLPRYCTLTEVTRAINRVLPAPYIEADPDGTYCHTSPDSLPKDQWFWIAIALVILCLLLLCSGTLLELLIWVRWKIDVYRERSFRGAVANQSLCTPLLIGSELDEPGSSQSSFDGAFDEGSIVAESESGVFGLNYASFREDFFERRSWLLRVLGAYSIPHNAFRLWNGPRGLTYDAQGKLIDHPLQFLNGIRFITMCWVIYGHCVLFLFSVSNNIVLYIRKMLGRWTYQVLATAPLSVDTFFFMSGLLVTYTLFPRANRLRSAIDFGKFWVNYAVRRFIRLTPAYLLVVILYTGLFNHAYDGPMFPQHPELTDVIFCRHHWWITYFNNLFYTDQTCLVWTWYLANEFQFSIFLAPIFITLIVWFPPAGIGFAICLILSAIVSTFWISYANSFLPGLITPEIFEKIYIKPYTRWGTYAIGLLVGWCLHLKRKLPARPTFQQSAIINGVGLSLTSIFCLSTVYGLYGLMSGQIKEISNELAAFYIAMHRPVFTLGVAIVSYLCANRYAVPIRGLLSWSGFTPLARLTYGAYLFHPIVILYLAFGIQSPVLLDNLYTIMVFFAVMVISFIGAFLISLVTESPLGIIEKLVDQRRSFA